ncbi:MAG: hypothetical protein PHQ01_03570 [Candidatus Pacebacteria bacterium]|nr:hypothetical protein [Candidatus Paceibacterota bacterium]
MVEKFVYNLEFPAYVNEFKIGDYSFKRVDNYSESFQQLQHLVKSCGSEYPTEIKTGSHQITAIVEIPDKEQNSVLPWADKNSKQILDILLLLTLFTGRNVFLKDWEEKGGISIMADHRNHQWGAQLHLSIKYESMWRHKETGVLKKESEMKNTSIFYYDQFDVGFEKSLNSILSLICSQDWQNKYQGGYFLFLFRQAVQRQIMETSFILCWSIWEHVFTLHNKKWLDRKTIETLSGYEKISFILNEYFIVNLDEKAKKEIGRLAKTRNRIIHYGIKTEDVDFNEMEMFIRLTEQLIAIILGLQPSNAFNSIEKLKHFLNGK